MTSFEKLELHQKISEIKLVEHILQEFVAYMFTSIDGQKMRSSYNLNSENTRIECFEMTKKRDFMDVSQYLLTLIHAVPREMRRAFYSFFLYETPDDLDYLFMCTTMYKMMEIHFHNKCRYECAQVLCTMSGR